MKKLLVLATLVIFSSFFALPSVVWAELDCKWEKIKEKEGFAWKCTGNDCKQCAKAIEAKAQSLKGKKCCECYGNGWPICYGTCCDDSVPSITPIQPLRR